MRSSEFMNQLFNKLSKRWNSAPYKENIPFICVGLISGVACCIYAILFSNVENISKKILAAYPDLIFASPFFLIIAFLSVSLFGPGSSGSGIPQVMVCLESKQPWLAEKFLSMRIIFVKIISSLIAIFAGASIGREGPSLQVSAAIGNNIAIFFHKLGIKIKSEQLIISGAASGLAAAFNTPIGGIVYAIEELSHDHIRSYKTVLLISVMISGFTAQLLMGNYLYLGYPKIFNSMTFVTISAVAAVSLLSGILGACFSKLLLYLIAWRKSHNIRNQILIVFLIGIAISFSYYFFGERAIYSGKDSINFVLFNHENFRASEFIFRFFTPVLSSMTGIAGGIFAPALSAGATFGALLAQLFDPSLRTLLGLAGMVGFLTGVTHTPITSFVIVLEMSDRHSSVFPMMLAAIFSSLGAKLIGEKSFYESMSDQIKVEST